MRFGDEIRTVRSWPIDPDGQTAERISAVRNRGILAAVLGTRQFSVTLGRVPDDATDTARAELRGSGTLIKWKDRPFILTCRHVLRACGVPDNERSPWQLWIVFNGETMSNKTLAGPLQLRDGNWWAHGTDAGTWDTSGPDIALVAVPYQWANDMESSDRANVGFHDMEVEGEMDPPEYAATEEDLSSGVVLHLCGGWHGALQQEVDGNYAAAEPIAAGFSMNLGWPSEFETGDWTYRDYPIIGPGITQRLVDGRGGPEHYHRVIKTLIGGGWGGFSGTGVWRIECDAREQARGVRPTLAGVVFAQLGDDEFSNEVPIGLRSHARVAILRALGEAERAVIHSNEEW